MGTMNVRRQNKASASKRCSWLLLLAFGAGCGAQQGLLNPIFVNSLVGGGFPLTPGPGAAFVLVRVINETAQTASFIVTIEREELVREEDGTPAVDDFGNPLTKNTVETVELQTVASAPGNEAGHLFPCGVSPVNRVGLGEDLNDLNSGGVFIGGTGAAGIQGFGVSAEQVPPLSREAGNFDCGDTIIFRASLSQNTVGGVRLESRLLRGADQPSEFAGPSTFETVEGILESTVPENGP